MLEIHPSARKHGIADEDIEHAVTHAIAVPTPPLGAVMASKKKTYGTTRSGRTVDDDPC